MDIHGGLPVTEFCIACERENPGPRPEGCSRLWCLPWLEDEEERE
ncbi:hypothetical protein SEA_LOZINAK_143 [Gordonia phage Lozinak]|uniref:Uncharacterized protein n=3 Tax=Smoothievirus TaxID=1982557 RepID=A0A2D1GFY8_9CAUD|nr:helicase [Gordonia phage ClubL]YP_009276257.1 helicase [Gordonia phage Bachita]ATN90769.1 hypothetical protein SEA_LOZINAK_143 [Gordonia phage Lozinak]AUE23650.1 hypothetical protein SEA_TONIANN_143 [Gordonia phage Toniann]QYC53625.1 hypothetical protein SEA_NORVS_141 [Gordonia phage Norvs]ANA86641.1 hypothetical protein PBI_CLUBL_143 [Gordonia phage ClubL]ANA86821.1 hypothetical protein PBI_BACHITA_146 [Gordonia phage Bachita]